MTRSTQPDTTRLLVGAPSQQRPWNSLEMSWDSWCFARFLQACDLRRLKHVRGAAGWRQSWGWVFWCARGASNQDSFEWSLLWGTLAAKTLSGLPSCAEHLPAFQIFNSQGFKRRPILQNLQNHKFHWARFSPNKTLMFVSSALDSWCWAKQSGHVWRASSSVFIVGSSCTDSKEGIQYRITMTSKTK